MEKTLTHLSGEPADGSQFDDNGTETFRVSGGEHDGHTVTIYSEKHNCGAYGESVDCSCGKSWHSAMYGCWQQGHQREESGDAALSEITRLGYYRILYQANGLRLS